MQLANHLAYKQHSSKVANGTSQERGEDAGIAVPNLATDPEGLRTRGITRQGSGPLLLLSQCASCILTTMSAATLAPIPDAVSDHYSSDMLKRKRYAENLKFLRFYGFLTYNSQVAFSLFNSRFGSSTSSNAPQVFVTCSWWF